MDALRLPATIESLEPLRSFVRAEIKGLNLSPEMISKVELVLEEVLVNVFSYAYPNGEGEVEVGCFHGQGRLCFNILDWGTPFDPLQKGDPDFSLDVSEQPVGGLGIYIVRSMADEVKYRRESGKNILTLCFKVKQK